MSTLEERLAYLEGRMEDQATLGTNMRNDVRDLRAAMSDLRAELKKDFVELRAEMRSDRHWLVGLLTTTAVAIGCAVVGLYFK